MFPSIHDLITKFYNTQLGQIVSKTPEVVREENDERTPCTDDKDTEAEEVDEENLKNK